MLQDVFRHSVNNELSREGERFFQEKRKKHAWNKLLKIGIVHLFSRLISVDLDTRKKTMKNTSLDDLDYTTLFSSESSATNSNFFYKVR